MTELTVKLNNEELELIEKVLCFAYCAGDNWVFNDNSKETIQNEITTLADKLRVKRDAAVARYAD